MAKLTTILAFLVLTAVSSVQGGAAATQSSTDQVAQSVVSVSGNQILLDGKPFVPRGYIFQAFTEVRAELQKCASQFEYCQRHIDAQDYYFGRGRFKSQGGLDVAKAWGANTIRLNVNQAAIDPAGPLYSTAYLDTLRDAVITARSRGFVVDIALFDGRNRNAPMALQEINPRTPLDNDVTLRAGRVLAYEFGSDRGVMLELLNEPFLPGNRDVSWKIWRDGGNVPSKRGFHTFVGVNRMIAEMRAGGAKNVIIVQGLTMSFKGFPGGVVDPLDQIVYSVHPFFGDGRAEKMDWDGNFGDFSKSHPVFLTAWGLLPRQTWCNVWGIGKPAEFLRYLSSHNIGMVAYALDVPYSIVKDFRTSKVEPTTFEAQCSRLGAPGELIRDYFVGAEKAK